MAGEAEEGDEVRVHLLHRYVQRRLQPSSGKGHKGGGERQRSGVFHAGNAIEGITVTTNGAKTGGGERETNRGPKKAERYQERIKRDGEFERRRD